MSKRNVITLQWRYPSIFILHFKYIIIDGSADTESQLLPSAKRYNEFYMKMLK